LESVGERTVAEGFIDSIHPSMPVGDCECWKDVTWRNTATIMLHDIHRLPPMMSFPCAALFICRILIVLVFLFPFALSANTCFGADDGYSGDNPVEAAFSKLGKAVEDFINTNTAFSGPVKDMYGVSMNSWCVGSVTGMNYIFAYLPSFNEEVGGWDVGHVTTMEGMVRYFSIDLVVGMMH
jgi:Mycoplasma protein of unknown function, DUF285